MKRKKVKGKRIQNMKNSESVKVFPNIKPFNTKKEVNVEEKYWHNEGYDTKIRKEGRGYRLFRSRKTKIGQQFGTNTNKKGRKKYGKKRKTK